MYIKYASFLLLTFLANVVQPCMPTTSTATVKLPKSNHSDQSRTIFRKTLQERKAPSNLRVTIKNQQDLQAKVFGPSETKIAGPTRDLSALKKESNSLDVSVSDTIHSSDQNSITDNNILHQEAFNRAKSFKSQQAIALPPTNFERSTEDSKTREVKAEATKIHTVTKMNERSDDKRFFNSEPDMCKTCPEMFLPTDGGLQKTCDNWKSLEENFNLQMDHKKPKMSHDQSITTCTRNVTCTQPHAIIKWLDYPKCDVMNNENSLTTFTYHCNGSHWLMQGFPIEAVSCALKKK